MTLERLHFVTPKDSWDDGPWHAEPDEATWTDEATGYQCVAARGPHGAWCGYVGVPKTHPAHGLDYSFDFDFDPDHREPSWSETFARYVTSTHIEKRAIDETHRRYIAKKVQHWTAAQGRYATQTMVNNISAHGELTWSGPLPILPDTDLWFFGFDCAHAFDMSPAINALSKIIPNYPSRTHDHETYRTLKYVRDEVAALVRQLHDIELTIGRVSVVTTEGRSPDEIVREIIDKIENTGTNDA
jgi:hypothetical protein